MAFKMKSGNAPAFKQMGSSDAAPTSPEGATIDPSATGSDSGASPLPFWKGLKNAVKNVARNNPISMATRAIKGEDVIKIDGMGGDEEGCDCGEEGISGEAMGTVPGGAGGIFGAGQPMGEEHWKKIQEKKSKAEAS